jgi:hypothetical protein
VFFEPFCVQTSKISPTFATRFGPTSLTLRLGLSTPLTSVYESSMQRSCAPSRRRVAHARQLAYWVADAEAEKSVGPRPCTKGVVLSSRCWSRESAGGGPDPGSPRPACPVTLDKYVPGRRPRAPALRSLSRVPAGRRSGRPGRAPKTDPAGVESARNGSPVTRRRRGRGRSPKCRGRGRVETRSDERDRAEVPNRSRTEPNKVPKMPSGGCRRGVIALVWSGVGRCRAGL